MRPRERLGASRGGTRDGDLEGPNLVVTSLQGSVQRLPVPGAGLLGRPQSGAHHLPRLHFYL